MKALLETRLLRAVRGALLMVPLMLAACGGVEDSAEAGDDIVAPEPAPGSIVSGAGRLTGKTFVLEATLGSPTSPTAASKDQLKLQVENPVR